MSDSQNGIEHADHVEHADVVIRAGIVDHEGKGGMQNAEERSRDRWLLRIVVAGAVALLGAALLIALLISGYALRSRDNAKADSDKKLTTLESTIKDLRTKLDTRDDTGDAQDVCAGAYSRAISNAGAEASVTFQNTVIASINPELPPDQRLKIYLEGQPNVQAKNDAYTALLAERKAWADAGSHLPCPIEVPPS